MTRVGYYRIHGVEHQKFRFITGEGSCGFLVVNVETDSGFLTIVPSSGFSCWEKFQFVHATDNLTLRFSNNKKG